MSAVGVVAIGRNEGERLRACLASIDPGVPVVYVDSGSTDGSPAAARAAGAEVVALDMAVPFTAARARNAGAAALPGTVVLVQFVDGDCMLESGWLAEAEAALAADPGLAAVSGRRRERHPEASRYNWLCDIEWGASPAGEARYFGGDVVLRRVALMQAGGYPETMIAGEEPDLSIRLRARGWRILRLDRPMTLHDAAILRFGQWWRRAERSGHAYAELAARHCGSPLQDYGRRLRGALFWGAVWPAAAFLAILAGFWHRPWAIVGGVALLLLPAQIVRLALRELRRRPVHEALTLGAFLMLAKPAQALGVARYWRGRLGGRRSGLIEYKSGAAA